MSRLLRRCVHRAWRCWRYGEPLPVDVYGSLLRLGIIPDSLTQAFASGKRPADILREYRYRTAQV